MELAGPREKILQGGATVLSESELLSVLLRTGTGKSEPGMPAVHQLANALLKQHGNLESVLALSATELGVTHGLGPAKIATLLSVGEICRRFQCNDRNPNEQLLNPQTVYELFSWLAYESQEVLCAAFLNSENRVLQIREIFRGILDGTVARPREIMIEALRSNAAKLLLAHNHPSDNPSPSKEDLRFTRLLNLTGRWLGIPLIDHLIICRRGIYYSFAEHKQLRGRCR